MKGLIRIVVGLFILVGIVGATVYDPTLTFFEIVSWCSAGGLLVIWGALAATI